MSKQYLAPAKVNLHLAVTALRADGFHELDTSFVYVDVGDVLTIELAKSLDVSCSDKTLQGKNNLVFQVLQAFAEKHKVQTGLKVFIDKKLPSQAGLGGGSSDAATALMVANQMWGIHCSRDELISFAAPFGADIPCFIYGKASLAQGIGEKLSPYPNEIPDEYVVLAWPGLGVSTVAAFKHFDENEFHALTDEKSTAKVRARSEADSYVLGYNDLEKSAVLLCSPLEDLLSTMREQSSQVWMSGSGSACVALCGSYQEAEQLESILKRQSLVSWLHIGHFLPVHPLGKNIGA